MAACWTFSGAGRAGWRMQKLMMSRPWRMRSFTSASTTKAFSVPSDWARWLISGIGAASPEKAILGRRDRPVPAGLQLDAPDRAAEHVGQRVARVARQRDERPATLAPDDPHGHGGRALGRGLERGIDARMGAEHVDALCGGGGELHRALLPALERRSRRWPQAPGRPV